MFDLFAWLKPKVDQKETEKLQTEKEKLRPRFRPAVERLEERISPSSLLGHVHGNHHEG